MARFELDAKELVRIEQAIKNFPTGAVVSINDVLHTDGGKIIEEEIRRLMPMSNVSWRGKLPHAKSGKSLQQENDNLAVTIRTKNGYHYLYFPDDGTTTRTHVGNKQFFFKGAEQKQTEIIDRCINRLVADFEQSI